MMSLRLNSIAILPALPPPRLAHKHYKHNQVFPPSLVGWLSLSMLTMHTARHGESRLEWKEQGIWV